MKTEEKRKIGKKNRKSGKEFERKVRADLTEQGWIVFRNDNQVVISGLCRESDGKCLNYAYKFVPAKAKWNNFTKRVMVMGSGMPDFVCIKQIPKEAHSSVFWKVPLFEVQFVEAKINGKLDKTEKLKIEWIKQNLHIPVFVAYQEKIGRKKEIKYKEV